MNETCDLAVVGGGAAGLAAAIFAAEVAGSTRRIVVLDGAERLGIKILVSGGGRCNVTHDSITSSDYNGTRPVVRNILAAFDVAAAVKWFASLGVQLKREETGKLFPVTDSAESVLHALLKRCAGLGVIIQPASRVSEIAVEADGLFTVRHARGVISSKSIILSTGGRSLPKSGSDGSGYPLARRLGHTVTPTFAALAPLVLEEKMFHAALAGIAQEVELSTFVKGKRIDRRRGSLLWTHFGISGPVVMDASRHWIIAAESGTSARMECNFLPGETFESVEQWLIELASSRARTLIVGGLSERMPQRVAAAITEHVGVEASVTCGQLTRDARRALVHALSGLVLPVVRHRGWNYAEVTAGGVPLDEIGFRTMESRKVPGVYLAGEILDCDGRIGGFNFQWAWATGYLAGRAAAAFIRAV